MGRWLMWCLRPQQHVPLSSRPVWHNNYLLLVLCLALLVNPTAGFISLLNDMGVFSACPWTCWSDDLCHGTHTPCITATFVIVCCLMSTVSQHQLLKAMNKSSPKVSDQICGHRYFSTTTNSKLLYLLSRNLEVRLELPGRESHLITVSPDTH